MLLDTSAWAEFFIKSEKGEIVKRYLKAEECQTNIVTLAEISNWAMKENLNGKELIDFAGTPVKPKSEDEKERLSADIAILKYLQDHGTFFAKEKIISYAQARLTRFQGRSIHLLSAPNIHL